MSYGKFFEQLRIGQKFEHWPGRTITEYDDTFFSLMSMNQHPLHVDEHFAKGTQHGQRLVEGPLVISLVIGMSQADVGGMSMETLEYRNVRHFEPVFHGDTIYSRSTIIALEELADGRRVAHVESEGSNQHGKKVVSLERRIVLPRETGIGR
jgi:acyl dehydratase